MAHFAEIDDNNTVIRVIVADSQEWCETHLGGTWIQTSYNTDAGVHKTGGTPLRKNYAGVGFTYDGIGFAPPKPFDSWTLNNDTYHWEPPSPRPTEGTWRWNEPTLSWIELIWDEPTLSWVEVNG